MPMSAHYYAHCCPLLCLFVPIIMHDHVRIVPISAHSYAY